MRVLIVEDEYLILDELEFFARAAGCTVIGSVPSAGEARSIYRSELPDVALLDIQLKDGLKGLDLAAELAEVGVMNWLLTEDRRLCQTHSRHALGCVLKPYRRESIFAALEISKTLKAGKSFPQNAPEGVILYHPDCSEARGNKDPRTSRRA
jgi:DNA-binding LytR/AlgR family response regulator